MSDGVPTPTLTWYKPDGRQIKKVTAIENIANVKMNVDQDFGGYKCDADNGLTPADYKIVKVQQISKCYLCSSGFILFFDKFLFRIVFWWGFPGKRAVLFLRKRLATVVRGSSQAFVFRNLLSLLEHLFRCTWIHAVECQQLFWSQSVYLLLLKSHEHFRSS